MSDQLQAKIGEVIKFTDNLTASLQQLSLMLNGMSGDQPKQQTVYSQRDPQWAADKMSSTVYTIGQKGCLMTCAASMLTDAGHPIDPHALNAWLNGNNGYIVKDGYPLFIWASIDVLGVVKFINRVDCWSVPAPLTDMAAFLNAGHYVLVEVDFDADPQRDQHWVRLLDMTGNIMDPWTGDIIPITHYRGRNLSECTRGVAYYRKTGV